MAQRFGHGAPTRANLPPSSCLLCPCRKFSTTRPSMRVHKTNPLRLLPKDAGPVPPYPYGPARWYKQRDSGLYAGVAVQFGNNVGEKSEVKSRRRWRPNIVHKRLYSAALDRLVTLRVSTRALRTIDKAGGLDNYLLGDTSARIKELGQEGWRYRWAVLQAPATRERLRREPALQRVAQSLARVEASRRAAQLEYAQAEGGPLDEGAKVEYRDDVTEGEQDAGLALNDRMDAIEQRLRRGSSSSQHMHEEPPPQTLLRRILSPFTRLFRR